MSKWQAQLEGHAIHAVLAELVDSVSGEMKQPDEVELAERRRFSKVVALYQRILQAVDPEVLAFNQLDALLNHFNQQILPQAKEYKAHGKLANLVAANEQVSRNLHSLGYFQAIVTEPTTPSPTPDLEHQLDNFAAALAQKTKEAEAGLQGVKKASAEQGQKLQDLEARIETRKQETDARMSEWQSQFSKAQEVRNTDFSKAQEARNTDYTTWRRQIDETSQAKVVEITDRVSSELGDTQKKYEAEIGDYLAKANADHQAIRQLHGLAAEDSVAGGYVSNAKKEGEAAARWRRVSVFFIGAAAAWLGYSFLSRNGQFSWEAALMTMPLTGVLLFGAAYSAQQSTRHRNVEVQNKRFALEMAAIDPYLQSLPEEDRRTLKKELTARFFGQDAQPDATSIYDEHAMKRVLESVGRNIIKPFADIAKTFK